MNDQIHIQREMGGEGKSKFQLYADLIVGKRGLGAVCRYEAVAWFATYVPGALGLWLRSKLYPLLLGSCGAGVTFGRGVVLRHPHKIRIGAGTVVDDNVLIDAKGTDNEGVTLGEGCFVGRNSILSCKNGDIRLGDRVNIGFNCEVFSGSRVVLGDDCLLAAYTYVVGGGHHFENVEGSVLDQEHTSEGITLGSGIWLGAGVKVLDGVSIGDHSVVGAGGVVTRDLPAHVVAAGLPAKKLRDR